ncbi:MAG: aminotransferase class V-fold PLP-dependent enzyme [Pseudomonadota bacterium]
MAETPSPWRRDFPQLRADTGLHYLDSAATSLKPDAVLETCTRVMGSEYGPIHRGLYPAAERATDAYEGARTSLSAFLGAGPDDLLIFTRSATESINVVAAGWLEPRLQAGDEVWVSAMEHHANYLPWQRACARSGARLRVLPLSGAEGFDLEAMPPLTPAVKMIALTAVSNVLGEALPIATVCERARAVGARVLVDAAQAVGHQATDFAHMGCDFLVASGHKMLGPTGVGVLLGRSALLDQIEPVLVGGGMVDQATLPEPEWAALPARLEAGSPNLVGAVGMAAAAQYLESAGRQAVAEHVRQLSQRARTALASIEGVTVYGVESPSGGHGIVSFNLQGVHPHDVGQIAGEQGVAVRAGHHCCQPLMQALGVDATARASFALYNDTSDVEALVAAVASVKDLFGSEQ